MQVGTADGSLGYLDDDIVHSHFGRRDVFHPDTGLGKSLDESFHKFTILSFTIWSFIWPFGHLVISGRRVGDQP